MRIIFTILLLIMCNLSYSQDFRTVVRELESKRRADNANNEDPFAIPEKTKPASPTNNKASKKNHENSEKKVVFNEQETNQYVRSDNDLINFTFNQVEVATFVKLTGDITGKKFCA